MALWVLNRLHRGGPVFGHGPYGQQELISVVMKSEGVIFDGFQDLWIMVYSSRQ